MSKKIGEITITESSALSDGDVFEGEQSNGASFQYAWTIVKSTLKTYFDALYSAITHNHDSDYVAAVASTDNALPRFDGVSGQVQNSGITVDDSDNLVGANSSLYGFAGEINAQTGTSYTTQDSDHGKVITLNNASAIALTAHSAAPAGFNCLIVQKGAGQVTVAAGGTGNIRNYNGHTKLAGQYATGSLFVESNAGTAPEVYFAGNTG
jgi:hypothetical protein